MTAGTSKLNCLCGNGGGWISIIRMMRHQFQNNAIKIRWNFGTNLRRGRRSHVKMCSHRRFGINRSDLCFLLKRENPCQKIIKGDSERIKIASMIGCRPKLLWGDVGKSSHNDFRWHVIGGPSGTIRRTKRGKTKVDKSNIGIFPKFSYQNILWLQIEMEKTLITKIFKCTQSLKKSTLNARDRSIS